MRRAVDASCRSGRSFCLLLCAWHSTSASISRTSVGRIKNTMTRPRGLSKMQVTIKIAKTNRICVLQKLNMWKHCMTDVWGQLHPQRAA